MRKKVPALVEHAMLKWARENAHYQPEAAAKRAQVSLQNLLKWEKGEDVPSVAQARRLAEVYRRPPAGFYLSEPPKDFQGMDYRRFGAGGCAPPSPGGRCAPR